MALHLVLSRSYDTKPKFNISRISCDSESEDWSTINLYPQFPNKLKSDCAVYVECSGNGLVCFCYINPEGDFTFKDMDFVIWNPSTAKFQLIPHTDSRYLPCACSSRRCTRCVVPSACGLGFINLAESHDYKFVRFMDNYNRVCNHFTDHNTSGHVAVYSSKINSWKELPFPFCYGDDTAGHIAPKHGAATCVNGFFYWTTYEDVILSFDLSTDKFSTLPYPNDIAPAEEDVILLELDGSLGLVIQLQLDSEKENKAITEQLFSFWVYESSSPSAWTRKINLDVRLAAEKPLWLGKKNNNSLALLLQGFDGALLEYDYTRRELKKIDQRHDHHSSQMIISAYVETNNANIAKNKINSTCEFGGWRAHLRPHSKVKCGNDDVVDWISRLPDDMIVLILSFLSLKEAASTSVLSTRWSDLWRHTPNLNFHDTHLKRYESKYKKWVNLVVGSHKALSLKEFNISFPLNYPTRRTVTKWLEFAFSRRVEVLELNLLGRRFTFLEKFLRKRSTLNSSNLRSLCLKCLEVSGEAIGLFLRNCPLLERLIIEYAVLTSDLEVCGGALKHLEIQYCVGGKSIKGYAPNLTCLKIDSCPFIIEDVNHPKLAWSTQQSADGPPPLFYFISSQLTTLEFSLYCPPKGFFEKGLPQMPTLRELIVTCKHGLRPITSLICAFPNLEEFEIKYFPRRNCYTGSLIEQKDMEAGNNVERFCYFHLRVFKFIWFDVGNGDHKELMSYILDNCVALQQIILDIYSEDLPSYVAAGEYGKQLQSKLPTHIQLIISFNNRQLV